jgi:tRNA U34 5-carboxymethylaminomethyl modifying enzyme MnmG/GidA
MNYGREFGLVNSEDAEKVQDREGKNINRNSSVQKSKLNAKKVNNFLESKGSSLIDSTETIANLCRRPELSLKDILYQDGLSNAKRYKIYS